MLRLFCYVVIGLALFSGCAHNAIQMEACRLLPSDLVDGNTKASFAQFSDFFLQMDGREGGTLIDVAVKRSGEGGGIDIHQLIANEPVVSIPIDPETMLLLVNTEAVPIETPKDARTLADDWTLKSRVPLQSLRKAQLPRWAPLFCVKLKSTGRWACMPFGLTNQNGATLYTVPPLVEVQAR